MYDQLAAVREAVGPKIDICVDMHGRYDLNTALAISRRVENLNLMWLEEPIPADNVEAYRLIAQETVLPSQPAKIFTWHTVSGDFSK